MEAQKWGSKKKVLTSVFPDSVVKYEQVLSCDMNNRMSISYLHNGLGIFAKIQCLKIKSEKVVVEFYKKLVDHII